MNHPDAVRGLGFVEKTGTADEPQEASGEATGERVPLYTQIARLEAEVITLHAQAGRSERGRELAIVKTDLEKLKTFTHYHGL